MDLDFSDALCVSQFYVDIPSYHVTKSFRLLNLYFHLWGQ